MNAQRPRAAQTAGGMAPGGVGLPVRLAGYLRSSPITLTLRCFDRREFDTGNTRHRLDWEREALAAGMDPVEVDIRRDLEENIHDAAEEVMEAVDRVCELLRPHSRGCVDRGCEQSGQVLRVPGHGTLLCPHCRTEKEALWPDTIPAEWEGGR